MISRNRWLLVWIFVVFIGVSSQAQVATGAPPFSTIQSNGFDNVNLANLNVFFDISVFNRAGRGTNFSYGLDYNSTIWRPVTSGANKIWLPTTTTWGWSGTTQTQLGYVDVTTRPDTCTDTRGNQLSYNWKTYTFYHDPLGVTHTLPPLTVVDSSGLRCDPNIGQTGNASGTINDGSGLQISVTFARATVTARDGSVGQPTTGVAGGAGTRTDSNGNRITTTATSITDTLGTVAVSISGGSPNPLVFTYTSPSNAPVPVTVTYGSHSVRTAFGCAAPIVSEYGPTNNMLVDYITLADGVSKYEFTYEKTPDTNYPNSVTGRIATVKLPTGGTITYTYTGANDGISCTDGSTLGLNRQTSDGTWAYSRTIGTGAASITTVTKPDTKQTKLQFQGIYQTKREVFDGPTTGTLLQTTDTCYDGNTNKLTCTTTPVSLPISQRTSWTAYPSASGVQNRFDTFYNGNGLATEIDEYDFGAVGAGPAAAMARKTIIAYNTSLGNGIVDRPSSISVYEGSSTLRAQTTFGYDETAVAATTSTPQLSPITGSRGNPTSIHRLVAGSTTLDQTFTYFDTGTVKVATDVNSAQTSYLYGACGNSFPTGVTLPLSMTRSAGWNCAGGVMTSTTDENSKVTSVVYSDPYFWRPASATDAANATTSFLYLSPNQFKSELDFNAGASTNQIVRTLDGLGRLHLTQKRQGPSTSSYDSSQVDYDVVGRVSNQSLPFSAALGSGYSSFTGTTTIYDGLGRPTSVTDTGNPTAGVLSYSYTYNDVLQSIGPAPTNSKQLEYDGLGRLTSVCEISSTAQDHGNCTQSSAQVGLWTKYAYNALGKLTSVLQSAQGNSQARTYNYDGLGRIILETNPESATIYYTYDSEITNCNSTSKGDLVMRKDAESNITCYKYDALHRVTSITYPSGTYATVTASKYFVYDSASITFNGVSTSMSNAKNRLAEAYTCSACPGNKLTDLAFSYSPRGETVDAYEWTQHSSGWYRVSGTYWEDGGLRQMSTNLGSLPTVTYNPDGEGRTSTVSAPTGTNIVSATSYNSSSQVTDVTLGSGDSDHYSYDATTGQLKQYKFTVGSTPHDVVGNLAWNANGSLASLAITNYFNPTENQTCNFGHDDLSRLASVSCGSTWSQTFGFDPFGNVRKTGSWNFDATYSASTNRIATLTGAPAPTYDNNGNLKTITDSTGHIFTWDAEGKQLGIDSLTATYDALGRLVELNNSGIYAQTVYDVNGQKLALMNAQTLVKAFVALPSGSAVYTASGLSYYRHSDWLGSSRFASTASTRTMYSSTAYAPYGEAYAEAGTVDRNFTGQDQDVASGYYDYLFRRLSAVQGRWISPDPGGISVVDPNNPQTWNRYAYVANNPMAMIDPLGLDTKPCGLNTWCTTVEKPKCPGGNCGGSPLPGSGPGGGSGGGTSGGNGGGPAGGGGQGRGGGGGGAGGNNDGDKNLANAIKQLQDCGAKGVIPAQTAADDLTKMLANGRLEVVTDLPSDAPGNTVVTFRGVIGAEVPKIQVSPDVNAYTLFHEWLHKTQTYGNPLGAAALGFNKILSLFNSQGEGPVDTQAEAVTDKILAPCVIPH